MQKRLWVVSTGCIISWCDNDTAHKVISEIFRVLNTKADDRAKAGISRWVSVIPYVNGGLFSGGTDVPRFSRIAHSYLVHIGRHDWTKIKPGIFGSMIQTATDDEERGALGMHYTSVPKFIKMHNPLFLNDLRKKLEEARDDPRKLLNLRIRIARSEYSIQLVDPVIILSPLIKK